MAEEKPVQQQPVKPVTPNTTIKPPAYDVQQHTIQGGIKVITPNIKK